MMDTLIKQEITEKPPAREVILTWKEKPKETSKYVLKFVQQWLFHSYIHDSRDLDYINYKTFWLFFLKIKVHILESTDSTMLNRK